MPMTCQEAADRMAGWLDGELSPGEAELFARHLDRCPGCSATLRLLEGQRFAAPRLRVDPAVPGFWDGMDRALDREWARLEAGAVAGPSAALAGPWWRRELRLPASAALALAVAFVLTAGLSLWQAQALARQGQELAQVEARLDRELRLAATPRASPPVEPVGLVAHTPFRGSL
ncbi:zf-HC2 domain-containing protein [Myxococcota bacterium]|nr:zf-HC2 domain-containing protein [Myxococcota bacterium]